MRVHDVERLALEVAGLSLALLVALGRPSPEARAEPAAAATSEHWAFVAPARPPVPSVPAERASWVRTPIDAFVVERLEREGLAPAGEADRRTLIRRLSLDLTGLPPSPEEVRAFVDDEAPDAYERVVEELLARPQFGERLALRWLDLARYADTNGYSIDGGRHMWAWRDWVIDAYNANTPFDRFTLEQLAGDLLPDATASQRIASGFNRNHMNTHEGGTIEEEYRVAYVADRVKTTAETWMGLTMGCAQCHDHKYDPITQREYYRFFAYFDNITERGNDGNGGINSVPFMPVYDDEQRASLERLGAALQEKRAALYAPDDALDAAQRAWESEEAGVDRTPPTLGTWFERGPLSAPTGDEAFATDFGPESALDLAATLEDGSPAWIERPDLEDGVPHALVGERSAWYFHRTITSSRASEAVLSFGSDDAIRVWLRGALIVDQNVRRGVQPGQERVTVDLRPGENDLLVKIVNDGGPGGMAFALERSGPSDEVLAALAKAADDRSDAERDTLMRAFRDTVPRLQPLRDEIEALELEVAAIEAAPRTTVMVMEERAMPRETYVLDRGRYDVRGELVTPGVPASLPPLPADAPANRLGLARWLLDPAHPLTARVAVNGFWQMLFGTGLVKTSEDFGTQGEAPSHPELLDWLAVEFVASGWDVKALLRLMVSSSVYRQSSHATREMLERDPENRLLARGASFRLPAELIRDQALCAGGLLSPRVGGPSARPYQPDGLWREMSHFGSTPATEQVYVQGTGEDLYRRSLYTIWKRTVPPPPMVAFDAPNRELCTPRRGRTNTPLQALVLLNETGFVEAARGLAARIVAADVATPRQRVDLGFEIVTARTPTSDEREILVAAYERERARFTRDREAASALLAVGESPLPEDADEVEHAAWTVVASTLLNLSETVTRN